LEDEILKVKTELQTKNEVIEGMQNIVEKLRKTKDAEVQEGVQQEVCSMKGDLQIGQDISDRIYRTGYIGQDISDRIYRRGYIGQDISNAHCLKMNI